MMNIELMNVELLLNALKTVTDMELSTQKVQKGNRVLTGIYFGSSDIRPVAYMEYYEDIFDSTKNYFAVANAMLEQVKNSIRPNFDKEKLLDWNEIKTKLQLCIAPKGTNKDFITYPYLDMEMYIRVIVSYDESGTASFKLSENHLNTIGITSEQLFHAAVDCTKPTITIKNMSDILPFIDFDESPMTIISNNYGTNGASAIYFKDVLKRIADKYGSDLIVLPSSIHEVIVVPTEMISLEDAKSMVTEINTDCLDPEEKLSDNAYIFHRDTMEITW